MTIWRKISKTLVLSALIGAMPAVFAHAEVPYLLNSVQSGLLPPMEKRLPENPLVVTPGDGQVVGKYDVQTLVLPQK